LTTFSRSKNGAHTNPCVLCGTR